MLIYSLKVCQFPKTAILSLNLDISIRPIPKQYLTQLGHFAINSRNFSAQKCSYVLMGWVCGWF